MMGSANAVLQMRLMHEREQNLKMAVHMERLTEQLERVIARNMELVAENERLREELEKGEDDHELSRVSK
jgi:regulator of replication initiation timing